jgi:hypothetical protein
MVQKVFKKTTELISFLSQAKISLKRSLNKKEKKKNMKGENVKIERKKHWKKNFNLALRPQEGPKPLKQTGMNVNLFMLVTLTTHTYI